MEEHGVELLQSLGDFTVKENWDKFFTLRGGKTLSNEGGGECDDLAAQTRDTPPVQILVPGCGSSRMSEHLYDAGYRNITNIDFSKVIISDMLRRNVRVRPEMKWRTMDMTEMQFADGFFDAVIDKGGLDALMEPKLGAKLGCKFLKEVKRVLKLGGKYICLTLAEFHVLGLLLSEFRHGWKTTIHVIPDKLKRKSSFQTYMVVAVKEGSSEPIPILSSFDHTNVDNSTDQNRTLVEAIDDENKIRNAISSGVDVIYSWEDLRTGVKGTLKELLPGRRCRLILGEQDVSCFSYNAVLLDAQQGTDAFLYRCGIFIVAKNRAHEWLFSSEEGQWAVVESSKAARLVMVFLDSSHSHASIDAIKRDLSPLVKDLAPEDTTDETPIPFMMANDGIKERTIVKKVTSTATGPIIIEDVVLGNTDSDSRQQESTFRRLIFERSLGLVQSEALLSQELVKNAQDKSEKNINSASSRHRKKGSHRRGSRSNLKVDHGYLASSYHSGIISGFILVASALEDAASCGKLVKTAIVGLGAGLLPMYLHGCMPFLDMELLGCAAVVELDPVVLDVARTYFDFTEDDNLKVRITDGIQYIQRSPPPGSSSAAARIKNPNSSEEGEMRILVIDADASDVSSGLTCPPAEFLEESLLSSAREFVGDRGLFIVNLVSRSKAIREMIISRMNSVFDHLHSLELEEDVNEVLFATPSPSEESSPDALARFQELLKLDRPERAEPILDSVRKIRCLK
ncbi:unnamed protein product [Spirodela intermedia]|uniref:Methyltransferase type 11 domain-containing protein n=1 Tax=Spirodela intermedia TaxID=51605 RepID=A0A7I8IQU2_SPIIN|nr:unnamed protein product [Spirodela intermedia]CAA6659906.1 unnamed protein product [Spirodela intermedia]